MNLLDKLKQDILKILAKDEIKYDDLITLEDFPSLQNNAKFILELMEHHPINLRYISKELLADKEFILNLLKKNGNILADDKILKYGEILKYTSEKLNANKCFMIKAVKQDGLFLQYASEELKNNKKVVIEAVKQNGFALKFASKTLQNNQKVVLIATKDDGRALQYASDELKANKKVVLQAVRQNGLALQYASYELRNSYQVLFDAINQEVRALKYVSYKIKKQFISELKTISKLEIKNIKKSESKIKQLSKNGLLLENYPELQNNKEAVLIAVRQNGLALQFASEELKDDYEVVFKAVKEDYTSLRFITNEKMLRKFVNFYK